MHIQPVIDVNIIISEEQLGRYVLGSSPATHVGLASQPGEVTPNHVMLQAWKSWVSGL